MPHLDEHGFTASPEIVESGTLLFDMDGTIIDSTAAIVKYWKQIGREIGVDGDVILQTSHGRRSIDVLSILKPELANWEFVSKREGQIPLQYGSDAVEIPGSRALLDEISRLHIPWGIVTSGTRPLVTGWLDRMTLAHPETMVTAEDVAKGKPDPACYRLGAERVAAKWERPTTQPDKTVVFEDAPAGIRAGKAAGYKVVALATTHSIDAIKDAGPDWIVKDMRSVIVSGSNAKTGVCLLKIDNALVS